MRKTFGALAFLALLPGCAAPGAPREPAVRVSIEAEDTGLVAVVRAAALPLGGGDGDFDALLERVGDSRVVLLGESTHGTHEFYDARARITRRLVREKGFTAVAVEADWPDAYRVNRYVRGAGTDRNAAAALSSFERFPTWMWRNADVARLVEWMREHNRGLPEGAPRAGFYGLDVYSLHPSIEAVTGYLESVDPQAARRARQRYACFNRFREDPVSYGQAVELRDARSCAPAVAEQLRELDQRAAAFRGDPEAEEALFAAHQNARVVRTAEEYYRSMYLPGVSTWNLRDRAMVQTLATLVQRMTARGEPGKVVVWAHNSHVGDARATHMGEEGEVNLGQLSRERWGRSAFLVGFTTHTGTVRAASEWGGPPELKRVRPALPGSYELLFHQAGIPAFLLPLREGGAAEALRRPRLERAIGVIYLPQTERQSHYFHARLASQFDAVIHYDTTRAVEPLDGR